jgi:protein-glutamine gamma-glutamyltransferase
MNAHARTRLRSRFRDFAALSACAAVALSGTLPAAVLIGFALCWLASAFQYRPLHHQRGWSVFLLLVAAVTLFGLAYIGALDLIIAAVSFAVLLTGQRLISEATLTVERQVLLASLLLMAGGAALSGELWYAACLIPFTVSSCFCLGLATIETDDQSDIDTAPVMRRLAAGSAVTMLLALLFFVFFPRISWNLASKPRSPGVLGSVAGMADKVRLGGGGTIKTSARVVARVSLTPSTSSEQLDSYFVGRIFERFDGAEWSGAGQDQTPRFAVSFSERRQKDIQQDFELTPAYGAQTLLGLREPVLFSNAYALQTAGAQSTALVESRGEEVRFSTVATGYRYTAFSREGVVDEGDVPEPESRLTDVPAKLDPRIVALASSIVKDETRPRQKALRIERFLKSNLAYTLELPGAVSDPLSHFLFERKAGHCEDFATALTVMLRTQGVPARIAAGFYGAERAGDQFVIRAGNAHVWTQAFIAGRGWTDFDATPEAGRLAQPPALWSQIVGVYESLEDLWRKRVVDYSIQDQLGAAREAFAWQRQRRSSTNSLSIQPKAAWPLLLVPVPIAAWLWWKRRRSRSTHQADSFLRRLEPLLSRVSPAPDASESVEEFSLRLRHLKTPVAKLVGSAARYYLEIRFGQRAVDRAKEAGLLMMLSKQLDDVRPASSTTTTTRREQPAELPRDG